MLDVTKLASINNLAIKNLIDNYNKAFQITVPEFRKFMRAEPGAPTVEVVEAKIRALIDLLNNILLKPEIINYKDKKFIDEGIGRLNQLIDGFNERVPVEKYINKLNLPPVGNVRQVPNQGNMNAAALGLGSRWWETTGQAALIVGGFGLFCTTCGILKVYEKAAEKTVEKVVEKTSEKALEKFVINNSMKLFITSGVLVVGGGGWAAITRRRRP